MNKLLYILLLVVISLFIACEKIIDVKIPDNISKIVINGFFSPDSIVAVHISKSLHILDNMDIVIIENAQVQLFKNDVFIENLEYKGNGLYISTNIKPKPAVEYKIIVSAPGFNEAYSKDIIPDAVPIKKLTTQTKTNSDNVTQVLVDVFFNDPPNEKNYYILHLKSLIYTPDYQPVLDYVFFQSNDPVIEEWVWYGDGAIFSDDIINGKDYKLSLFFDKYSLPFKDTSTVFVFLKSISHDLYMYAKTYSKQVSVRFDPFAEPVQVYNNVKNGYGIFAGFSTSVDSIQVILEESKK